MNITLNHEHEHEHHTEHEHHNEYEHHTEHEHTFLIFDREAQNVPAREQQTK